MYETSSGGGQEGFKAFNAPDYIDRHFSQVSDADSIVAHGIILALRWLHDGTIPQKYESLKDAGTGGVLRTACFASPLLKQTARVVLSDTPEGKSQLSTTGEQLQLLRRGQRTMWHGHAEDMSKARPVAHLLPGKYRHMADMDGHPNPEWMRALDVIEANAIVTPLDLFEEQVGESEIRTEGHVLCSITDDKEKYEQAVANFYAGMKPGDIAVRQFDINSTGYTVSGKRMKGYPINPDEVESQAERMGLIVVTCFGVDAEFSNDGANQGTGSTLSGLGGAVLLKPGAAPSVLAP